MKSDWFPARSPSPSPGVGQVPGHRPALRADGLHGASAQVDGRLTTYSGLAPTPHDNYHHPRYAGAGAGAGGGGAGAGVGAARSDGSGTLGAAVGCGGAGVTGGGCGGAGVAGGGCGGAGVAGGGCGADATGARGAGGGCGGAGAGGGITSSSVSTSSGEWSRMVSGASYPEPLRRTSAWMCACVEASVRAAAATARLRRGAAVSFSAAGTSASPRRKSVA